MKHTTIYTYTYNGEPIEPMPSMQGNRILVREAEPLRKTLVENNVRRALYVIRKGTDGVSTNGVIANFVFFDRGTFWVLPLTYFCLPRSARV